MPDTLEMDHLKLYSLKDSPPLNGIDRMRTTACIATTLTWLVIGHAPSAVAQEPSITTLQFIAPGDNELKQEAMGCGLQLGFAYVIDNVEGSRSGRVELEAPGRVSVTTFKGAANGSIGKGRRQAFVREVTHSPERCSVTFRAEGPSEGFKKGRLVNLWEEPDFSPLDVLVQSYKFQYEFSLPSEFPTDAVLANFDRLADKGCSHVGYSMRLGFDFRNDGPDRIYCLAVDGKQQPARVNCGPYRNGSKCTVFAVLQAKREGGVISALDGTRLLHEAVTKIVND